MSGGSATFFGLSLELCENVIVHHRNDVFAEKTELFIGDLAMAPPFGRHAGDSLDLDRFTANPRSSSLWKT